MWIVIGIVALSFLRLLWYVSRQTKENKKEVLSMIQQKEIYVAGGCFWGMQAYFENIPGVISATVGYANGQVDNPTYELVCSSTTGFAEAIHVLYDSERIDLSFLLDMYVQVIDPTQHNRQGNDIGSQYRTGIYYTDEEDKQVILTMLSKLQAAYQEHVVVECMPLINFYPAETYHQHYLRKHPNGYCHIPRQKIEEAASATPDITPRYMKPDKAELQRILSNEQYLVTQENKTEKPFQNAYWNQFDKGIYVDITTGEPLFVSDDKFDAGCGWPSFFRPIHQGVVKEVVDKRLGMTRTEVRSSLGDAHLGHVFDDGPKERGGLRYCMNSAALRFIPYDNMEKEGYHDYRYLFAA